MSGDHDMEEYFMEQEAALVEAYNSGLIGKEVYQASIRDLRAEYREALREMGYED
jgi:predicted DNA-binding protein (UPF0278 family)